MSRLKYVRHCLCNALYVYCRGRAVTNVGKTFGPTPCFVLAINTFKLIAIWSPRVKYNSPVKRKIKVHGYCANKIFYEGIRLFSFCFKTLGRFYISKENQIKSILYGNVRKTWHKNHCGKLNETRYLIIFAL